MLEKVKKPEPLYTASGNVKWCSHYGKRPSSYTQLPSGPGIPLLGICPRELKTHSYTETCVCWRSFSPTIQYHKESPIWGTVKWEDFICAAQGTWFRHHSPSQGNITLNGNWECALLHFEGYFCGVQNFRLVVSRYFNCFTHFFFVWFLKSWV